MKALAELKPEYIARLSYHFHPLPFNQKLEDRVKAFHRDFEVNGPSFARLIVTHLKGRQGYKNDPEPRIRKRYIREAAPLRTVYAAATGFSDTGAFALSSLWQPMGR